MAHKKVPGRPSNKSTSILLSDAAISNEYNFNKQNIVPLCNMNYETYTEYDISICDYDVYFKSYDSKIFTDIISVFYNHKYETICLYFDNSGILFTHSPDNNHNNICNIQCKISSNKLISYKIRNKICVESKIKNLYTFLHGTVKNNIFLIKIISIDTECCKFKFKADISKGNIKNIKNVVGSYIVKKKPYLQPQKTIEYDNIILLDAESIVSDFSDLKKIANLMDIIYSNNILKYQPNHDLIKHKIVQHEKKHGFHTIKKSSTSYIGTYNISTFHRFLKYKQSSQIAKIYLSNGKPLIIEFDVGIKNPIGSIQLHVNEINIDDIV